MTELTIYEDLEQRSDAWFAARAGLVTASTVGRLISISAPGADAYECPECAAPTGEPCISLRGGTVIKTMHSGRASVAADKAASAEPVLSVADNETSRGLIRTLAAERITGFVEEAPMTHDMVRGIEWEPFARDAYVEHSGSDVDEVGFMARDFGSFKLGCSPDGLVANDGMIEIKSPRARGHIDTILADKVPAHYMAQVQAALLVSGRNWLHYVSFHGGLALYTKRVNPDPAWQNIILAATQAAEDAIANIVERYQQASVFLPKTERIPDLDELVI